MKKRCYVTAAALCIAMLSGCQRAPEPSADEEIYHAQSEIDQQIADIVKESEEGRTQRLLGSVYEGTIGTTDNKMSICAPIPDIPEKVYQITLKPDEGLDMDALKAFLDSTGGRIEDTSQKLLEEIEKSDYYNTHNDDGEILCYSNFGDHSALQLKDKEKEAAFTGHTSAGYVDDCWEDYIAGIDTETILPIEQPDTGEDFSFKEAEQFLRHKLEPLGITGIAFKKIVFCEGSGYCYYVEFVPTYEGTAMIGEYGAYSLGEIYPAGRAWVTPEGVINLSLVYFCGKIASKEPVSILSFEQVAKLLEQYLDSNMIQVDERLVFDNIKLEYYPVPNLSPVHGEIEYRSKLELIPVWHVYMPLDKYVESISQIDGLDNVCYNICINAVTGEIEKVW